MIVKNKKLLATLLLLTTTLIWGFAFVAQVKGSDGVPPFMFNGIRFLIGSVSLLPIVLLKDVKKDKKQLSEAGLGWGSQLWRFGITGGFILCMASVFQQYGCTFTQSSGLSGFLSGLYTIITPIGCLIIYKKKPPMNFWIGFFCAIIGTLILTCFGLRSSQTDGGMTGGIVFIGIASLILSAFLYSGQIIFVDSVVNKIDPIKYSLLQMFFCAVFSLIFGLIFECSGDIVINGQKYISGFSWAGVLENIGSILYCGKLSVGVAYTLQIIGQKLTNANHAAIIFTTEAMFSAIGGAIFGLDDMTLLGYIGCAVIFGGILISQIKLNNKKRGC